MSNTGSKKERGMWVLHTGPLPPGATRGWNAIARGFVWAGIFEIQPTAIHNAMYVLVYWRPDNPKAITEKLPSLQIALDRGSEVLNAGAIVGRKKGTDDPEFYRRNVPGYNPQ